MYLRKSTGKNTDVKQLTPVKLYQPNAKILVSTNIRGVSPTCFGTYRENNVPFS